MMQRTFLIILISAMVLPACKKGDNDPYLSLRSRKNRLKGTWELVSYTRTANFGSIRSVVYDEESGLTYETEDSTTYTQAYQWTMTFDRNGNYNSEEIEDFPADTSVSTSPYTETRTTEGIWEFTGGNDTPVKSQLLLLTEETRITRSNQGSNIDISTVDDPIVGIVYNIDKLANDELWLYYSVKESFPFEVHEESVEIKFSKQR